MKKAKQTPDILPASGDGGAFFELRLFVGGNDPTAEEARDRIVRLCEARIGGRYKLDVIDISKDPKAALDNKVVLVPMLLRQAPQPRVTIIGSLHDMDKLSAALDLPGQSR